MLMPDEKLIVDYLKTQTVLFVSGREIARRADCRRRFEQDRGWALPALLELLNKGLIETDGLGAYRLIRKDESRKRFIRPISPQIMQILRNSGKYFDGVPIDLEQEIEQSEDEENTNS